LTATTIATALAAVALPYTAVAEPLGFVPLPARLVAFMGAATLTYLGLEQVKRLALAPASLHPAHPVLELQHKKRKEAS
jgi:Mg2+-importing ATPase